MIDFNSNSYVLILDFIIIIVFGGCIYMSYMCCDKKDDKKNIKQDTGYEPII